MNIYYSSKFVRAYKRLSEEIKMKLDKKEIIIKNDIFSKSLKTHKLSGCLDGYYSFSIDYGYRVIFEIVDETIVFCNVGKHDIY